MVKSELISVVSSGLDVTSQKAEELVQTFFDTIMESLIHEGRVEFRGFGALSVRKYRAYHGRNPKSGQKIYVPEKKLPFWKTGLDLKQRVDGIGIVIA